MTAALKVVAVSGGAYRPSRTLALTQAIIAELGKHLNIDAHIVELSEIARPLGNASESDLRDYQASSDTLQARIRLAAERALPLFSNHTHSLRKIA